MLNYNYKENALQYKLMLNSFYKNNYAKNLIIFLSTTTLHLIPNLISHLIFKNFKNINYSIFASKR